MSNILKNIILLNSAVLIVIEPVSASENIFGQETKQHGVSLLSVPQYMEKQESPAEYKARQGLDPLQQGDKKKETPEEYKARQEKNENAHRARQEERRSRQGLDPLQQGDKKKETPEEYKARQEKNENAHRARQEKNEKEHRARQEKYRKQLLDKADHLGLHYFHDASIEVLKTLIDEEKKSRQREWEHGRYEREQKQREWEKRKKEREREQRIRELVNSIGSVRSNHLPETNRTSNSSPASRSNYQCSLMNQPGRMVGDGRGGMFYAIAGKDDN